ncbi:MAG: T9SS type A sorting domain-containing protein [Bacteroidales bacterium]|nr:T9SS type A sorting domain-containing protein [Bacteroidales bacterium]
MSVNCLYSQSVEPATQIINSESVEASRSYSGKWIWQEADGPANTRALTGTAVDAISVNKTDIWKEGNPSGTSEGVSYTGENTSYYILSVEPGEYTFSASLIDTTTASVINSKSFSGLRIYPVPARESVIISNNSKIKHLEIFPPEGRMMQHEIINSESADKNIASLAPGIYLIQLTNHLNISVMKKFLKN